MLDGITDDFSPDRLWNVIWKIFLSTPAQAWFSTFSVIQWAIQCILSKCPIFFKQPEFVFLLEIKNQGCYKIFSFISKTRYIQFENF